MKMLSSKKGEGYIVPCVLILVIVILFLMIFNYAAAISKVNVVRENTKVVLDSFVTQNSTEIYNSIKQGNDYTDAVDSDEFRTSLMEFCTLENRSGKLYSMDSDGNEIYHISMPVLSFKESNQLELCVNFTVTVPIRLLNDTTITANIPLEVTSILTEKF